MNSEINCETPPSVQNKQQFRKVEHYLFGIIETTIDTVLGAQILNHKLVGRDGCAVHLESFSGWLDRRVGRVGG